ncbi:hypothetical protein OF83DRAFT_1150782 [Amylostereum chailletii]|nr:hypothetical protein OF83DRAFT_1150782 [Amylostereum chailletii]
MRITCFLGPPLFSGRKEPQGRARIAGITRSVVMMGGVCRPCSVSGEGSNSLHRPCGGCRKRGLIATQCVDGCEACRRERTRCDGGIPCDRCRMYDIECADEPTVGAGNPFHSQGSPFSPPDRVKLACKNCRRDNKKCEDHRPCGRCVLRGEECIRVGRGPKVVKVRCQFCRETNKKCEDARPCKHCVEMKHECFDPPRKGRGHGTRVKAACVSCRRDKIRCDGGRPCLSCSRKGTDCQDRGLVDWHSGPSNPRSYDDDTGPSHRNTDSDHGAHMQPPSLCISSSSSPRSDARNSSTARPRILPPDAYEYERTRTLPPLSSVVGWAVASFGQR